MFSDRDVALETRIAWDRKLRLRDLLASEFVQGVADFLAANCLDDEHDNHFVPELYRSQELDCFGNRALHYADTTDKINAILCGLKHPQSILSLLKLENKKGESAEQYFSNIINSTKKKLLARQSSGIKKQQSLVDHLRSIRSLATRVSEVETEYRSASACPFREWRALVGGHLCA